MWGLGWQVFVQGIPFRARPLDLVDLFEANAGTVTRIEGHLYRACVSPCANILNNMEILHLKKKTKGKGKKTYSTEKVNAK